MDLSQPNGVEGMVVVLEQLVARERQLVQALTFYADESGWDGGEYSDVVSDRGYRARLVLNKK